MNLLMITRKVDRDDSHAGHTYVWVRELARQLDGQSYPLIRSEADHPFPQGRGVGGEGAITSRGSLTVLCLQQGNISGLPDNVRVQSLGKEHGVGRVRRWLRFAAVVPGLVRRADAIFCHQNPEYTIAVWPFAKVFGKRIVTWYTHGTVTWKTKAVAKMADVILTASPESFRVPSPKVVVTGHGIDIEQFAPKPHEENDGVFRIHTVGRISPTKDYETLIKAAGILRDTDASKFSVKIAGGPGLPDDKTYFDILKSMVVRLELENVVFFTGAISHQDVAGFYQSASVLVNLSHTGSIDKAVLEAMACGCPVITANPAFRGIIAAGWVISPNDPKELARTFRVMMTLQEPDRQSLGRHYRAIVERDHNLTTLVGKIIAAAEGKLLRS